MQTLFLMPNLTEMRVKSFADLHRVLQRYRRSNLWLFRGHADPDWLLVPQAGRDQFAAYDDARLFSAWRRRSAEFLPASPGTEWDELAMAQHHGLATRLLDWSFNPLVAAFFAVWKEEADADATLFAYYSSHYVTSADASPFEFEGVRRFKPRGVAQRIIRQSGILTVHGPPTLQLGEALLPGDNLEKIIIDKACRTQLLYDLSYYGINRLSLFPDLDGLAAHVNWAIKHREYWDGNFEDAGDSG